MEADVHSDCIKKCMECECTVDCSAIGAPSGLHVTNLPIGEVAFTRTSDHAPVGHGMGVTTVAFVYDSCDHVPVKYPGPETCLPAEGRDASEESPDVKEGTARNLLCLDAIFHRDSLSNGSITKEVTEKIKNHAKEYNSGCAKANHCPCDVTPLC